MPIRILVVDDFEPLRRFVCSELQQRSEFQVIGQAADGLEAIQRAEELQPDLILLDIGLPKLNGIAAARQIRKLVPKSKILFLTENNDQGLVETAFGLGASAYVLKSDAGDELYEALETVIQDRKFVSRGLTDRNFTGVQSAGPRDILFPNESLAPSLQQEGEISDVHEVQFYSDEAGFLDLFTDFSAAVLSAGNVLIVIATESHRNGLLSKLQTRGLDIHSAIEGGKYLALDVGEALSTFMVNDQPDAVQFSKVVGDLLERATRTAMGEHRRVAACGECAPVLWAQGKDEAAIRVEQLWDGMARTYNVDTLCAYPLPDFVGETGQVMFERVCEEHTAVYSQ